MVYQYFECLAQDECTIVKMCCVIVKRIPRGYSKFFYVFADHRTCLMIFGSESHDQNPDNDIKLDDIICKTTSLNIERFQHDERGKL